MENFDCYATKRNFCFGLSCDFDNVVLTMARDFWTVVIGTSDDKSCGNIDGPYLLLFSLDSMRLTAYSSPCAMH